MIITWGPAAADDTATGLEPAIMPVRPVRDHRPVGDRAFDWLPSAQRGATTQENA